MSEEERIADIWGMDDDVYFPECCVCSFFRGGECTYEGKCPAHDDNGLDEYLRTEAALDSGFRNLLR